MWHKEHNKHYLERVNFFSNPKHNSFYCLCYKWFEICTLITKSIEPCTKAKLGYFSQIDVDTDCLNRIENFKIPLKPNEPCFWIIYKILVWLCQIFQKKIRQLGVLYFDSHCRPSERIFIREPIWCGAVKRGMVMLVLKKDCLA